MKLKNKTTREILGLAKVSGTIRNGPFGLIEIETEDGRLFVNANGIFTCKGEKLTTSKAKDIVGLS